MRKKQKVAEMADEVLVRQAKTRAKRTGEPLEAVMGTQAGRQLKELRNGLHRGEETAQEWQGGLARERTQERFDAPGWYSPNEVPGPPVDVSRRGPR